VYCHGNLLSIVIGDISHCSTGPTIHACKYPCFAKSGATDYLVHRKGHHLYLNMVDTQIDQEYFDYMIRRCRDFYEQYPSLTIHCNKGVSRSPSIALLLLFPALSIHEAMVEMRKIYPAYNPSIGVLKNVYDTSRS